MVERGPKSWLVQVMVGATRAAIQAIHGAYGHPGWDPRGRAKGSRVDPTGPITSNRSRGGATTATRGRRCATRFAAGGGEGRELLGDRRALARGAHDAVGSCANRLQDLEWMVACLAAIFVQWHRRSPVARESIVNVGRGRHLVTRSGLGCGLPPWPGRGARRRWPRCREGWHCRGARPPRQC